MNAFFLRKETAQLMLPQCFGVVRLVVTGIALVTMKLNAMREQSKCPQNGVKT